MLARVLKSTTSQPASSDRDAPTTPTKSSSRPPVSASPSHSHSQANNKMPSATKENLQPAPAPAERSERSNYLSFLFSQSQAGAPTTPVKVNKGTNAPVPPQAVTAARGGAYDEDVHMQTMKGTINPAMLKQLSNIPQPTSGHGVVPHRGHPVRGEDVHMQTQHKPQPKERQLNLWEREIADRPDVRRKATVAQIYFLDYYFDMLGYLAARRKRQEAFKADTTSRSLTPEQYAKELTSYNGRERVILRKRRTKLRIDQFAIVAQVGQGGYGSVYLARKIDTREICALKKMRKGTLAKMDEVKHVLVERDILTAVKTPWLVRLLYAFQDKEHVYLAMEYVPGGDFRTLLNNSGVLKEEHARFYAAEMFAGVNELHKLGYIHRDLKPENFLVDGSGHVKLTDFGLATGSLNPQKIEDMKAKLDRAKDEDLIMRSTLERRTIYRSIRMAEPRYADSVVGSPDYMPPEVLRGKTYTYSADYWSLGCILFEFLCGFPPFSGSTPEETWANLKHWQSVLKRPVYDRPEDLIFNLTDTAWQAVTQLIAAPKDRVSTLADVQTLPFFQDLPFASLRQLDAPFVPVLDGETDTGYFDSFSSPEDMAKYAEVFKKQRDVEAVEEKGSGNRNNWVGFTFGKNAHQVAPIRQALKADNEPLATIF